MSSATVPLQTLLEYASKQGLDILSSHFAEYMDMIDPLASVREEFSIPTALSLRKSLLRSNPELVYNKEAHLPDDSPCLYFTGNSLGLQAKESARLVKEELDTWASLGVLGHHYGKYPWVKIEDVIEQDLTHILGALPHELTCMTTLTTNLHLALISFYRPKEGRTKILMEWNPFPSDRIQLHGLDPKDELIQVKPRKGQYEIELDDIVAAIKLHQPALVIFPAVHYKTGQVFDMETITRVAHENGAKAGFDLAHAAGNIPLKLHDWDVDFGVWCSYKYLNSGPGGIGGLYIHERFSQADVPRLSGWWGHNLKTRFQMDSPFEPMPGTKAYRLSNPCVFAILSMKGTTQIMCRVGIDAMRSKSKLLTSYLEYLLATELPDRITILTPSDPEARGCQLTIAFSRWTTEAEVSALETALLMAGIVCDRRGELLRVAPTPLYNSFSDVRHFVTLLDKFV